MKAPIEKNLDPRDPKFPDKCFIMYVVGFPGSGKSFFIRDLIETVYKDNFDNIMLISPCLADIKIKGVSEKNKKDALNIAWVQERSNASIRNAIKRLKPPARPFPSTVPIPDESPLDIMNPLHTCLIMDDVCGDLKKMENKEAGRDLFKIFANRRHCLDHEDKKGNTKHLMQNSIILSSQHYKLCPLKLRTSINTIVCFRQNRPNLEAICREHLNANVKEFCEFAQKVFETKYGKIIIRDGRIIEPLSPPDVSSTVSPSSSEDEEPLSAT